MAQVEDMTEEDMDMIAIDRLKNQDQLLNQFGTMAKICHMNVELVTGPKHSPSCQRDGNWPNYP